MKINIGVFIVILGLLLVACSLPITTLASWNLSVPDYVFITVGLGCFSFGTIFVLLGSIALSND